MASGLRAIEQRVRFAGRAGARVGECAAKEELGIRRVRGDRRTKRVAGVPRRAMREMIANLRARFARRALPESF